MKNCLVLFFTLFSFVSISQTKTVDTLKFNFDTKKLVVKNKRLMKNGKPKKERFPLEDKTPTLYQNHEFEKRD